MTIDGPSKVKMDCVECPEGYRVTYTPMAPGSYLISIKYGGPYHIVGSPFKARISGESSGSPAEEQQERDQEAPVFQVQSSCPATARMRRPPSQWTRSRAPSAALRQEPPANRTPARCSPKVWA